MEPKLIQFSTVVVGKAHNPTILNPDFLALNAIVQDDWGWEVAETITTPPFSVVRYTCGVAVTVEFNKLQVTDVNVGDDPTTSKVANIAVAYVRTLRHVRYTAIGINLQSVVETTSPESYLRDRYIKSGPWHTKKRELAAAGIRLVYPLDGGGRVTLSLDAGEVQRSDQEAKKRVVIVNANFHRDCGEHSDHEHVAKQLTNVPADWSTYRELIANAITE